MTNRFEAKRTKEAQLCEIAKTLEAAIEKGRHIGDPTWADWDEGKRVYTQPGHRSLVPASVRQYDLWRVNALMPAIRAGFLETSRVIEGALVTLRISEGENRGEEGGEEEIFLVLDIENSLMLPDGVRVLNWKSDVGLAIRDRIAGETVTIHSKTPLQHISIVSVS